eukprot:g3050.t1
MAGNDGIVGQEAFYCDFQYFPGIHPNGTPASMAGARVKLPWNEGVIQQSKGWGTMIVANRPHHRRPHLANKVGRLPKVALGGGGVGPEDGIKQIKTSLGQGYDRGTHDDAEQSPARSAAENNMDELVAKVGVELSDTLGGLIHARGVFQRRVARVGAAYASETNTTVNNSKKVLKIGPDALFIGDVDAKRRPHGEGVLCIAACASSSSKRGATTQHVGRFVNGRAHGDGIFLSSEGQVAVGCWEENKRVGDFKCLEVVKKKRVEEEPPRPATAEAGDNYDGGHGHGYNYNYNDDGRASSRASWPCPCWECCWERQWHRKYKRYRDRWAALQQACDGLAGRPTGCGLDGGAAAAPRTRGIFKRERGGSDTSRITGRTIARAPRRPVWPSLMQRFPPSSAKEWLALARNTRIMNSRSVQKYLRKRRMFDGGSSATTVGAPAASAPAASAPPHHHRNIFGPLIHLKHRFFLEDSMFRLLDRRGTNSESDSGYEAGYETDADESDALSDFFSGAASSRNISGGVGAGPYGQMNRISRKRKIDALVNLTMRMSLQKCHQQSGRSGSGGGGAINRAAGAAGGGIVGVAAPPGAGGENNDDDMGLVHKAGGTSAGPGAGDHGGGSSLGGSYSGRSDGRSSPDHDQFTSMLIGPGQSGDEAEDEYNESMVGQYYVPGRGYMDIEPIREEELPLREEEVGGGAGSTTRAETKADENRTQENGNGNTHMEGQSDEENN